MQNSLRNVGRLFTRHVVFPQLVFTHLAVVVLSVSLATAQDAATSTEDRVAGESSQPIAVRAPEGVVVQIRESHEAIHDQLRQFRTEIELVVEKGDWEELRPFLSSRVVVVWLDGTQSHGIDQVIDYLQSKTDGENAIVDRFTLTTEVAELSDLYGQTTAIAFGTAESGFILRGRELSMEGPWLATMIKEGDDWKLASLTASVGAFDNPLLVWTRRMLWIVGVAVCLVGLVIGWFIGRRTRAAAH